MDGKRLKGGGVGVVSQITHRPEAEVVAASGLWCLSSGAKYAGASRSDCSGSTDNAKEATFNACERRAVDMRGGGAEVKRRCLRPPSGAGIYTRNVGGKAADRFRSQALGGGDGGGGGRI